MDTALIPGTVLKHRQLNIIGVFIRPTPVSAHGRPPLEPMVDVLVEDMQVSWFASQIEALPFPKPPAPVLTMAIA